MKVYTLEEAATVLPWKIRTIRGKVVTKQIKAFKIDGKGKWLIKENEINRILERR